MTTLALNTLSRPPIRSPLLSASVKSPQAGPRFRKRWLHHSLSRQAILMPAMSPFMTSGTITCWKKHEGEAFAAGDVLLQIESDIAVIDVEAESAGVLGKILLPDGSQDVAVEQVIALVVNGCDPTNKIYQAGPTAPHSPIPSPICRSMASPARTEMFQQPFMPSIAHRSPTHSHHHRRGMATQPQTQKLTIVPPSPRTMVSLPTIDRPALSAKLHTASAIVPQPQKQDSLTMDGATIRQIFRSNFSRDPLTAVPPCGSPSIDKTDTNTRVYFEGIL